MPPLFLPSSRAALLLKPLSLLSVLTLTQSVMSQPFKADEETLLLADFEKDPYRAAYANGWENFSGSGAPLIEGYYGKAIDLTGRPAKAAETPNDLTQWAFWPKGNIRYEEGTFEFWFRADLQPEDRSLFDDSALFFYSIQQLRPKGVVAGQPVKEDGTVRGGGAIQASLRLNKNRLAYKLITVAGKVIDGEVNFRKTPGFNKSLNPQDWHHFAMTWADGALVFYVDGQKAAVHDISGQHGLALISSTQRPIAMSGLIVDELRISSVARYRDAFEPNWRDGERPAYAFASTKVHPDIPTRYRAAVIPSLSPAPAPTEGSPQSKALSVTQLNLSFDQHSGNLIAADLPKGAKSTGNEGLELLFGTERKAPEKIRASHWTEKDGTLSFDQDFDGKIAASHSLTKGDDQTVCWKISLKNSSAEEQWIEVRLGVPVPLGKVADYFDASRVQENLQLPRRRDEYIYSLPFVAASDGTKSIGLGINPGINLSSLISEWVPNGTSGVIRQGTRLVLSPGESFDLDYRLLSANGKFGSLDAVDAYHRQFKQFYRQIEDVPIQSYMPVAQHFKYVRLPDLARQFYIGNQWGHGPYHTKGDYMGTPKYWENPEYQGRADYVHAQKHQKLYKSIENLHQRILSTNKESFDYYYSLRRSHDVPNLTVPYIVDDLYPQFDDKDDPLVAGQYYLPTGLFVNETNTPLGKKFIDDQTALMKMVGRYSPGLINDMCQISPYRFIDPEAQKTSGRAFSEDRGVYTIGAFGHVQRYEAINAFTTEGHRQSMWSDFGMVSYMLSAHSSADCFEAGERFWGLTSLGGGFEAMRFLLGEKPTITLVSYGADQLGKYYKPEEFTPASLREHYRRNLRSTLLFALKRGVYLDPPYLHGHQWMVQSNPILIESIVHGRKLIPGARVADPLWVVRGGSGWDSLWSVGNETAEPHSTRLEIDRQYFDGAAPIVVPYFGGSALQHTSDEGVRIEAVEVPSRDLRAFKTAGRVLSVAPVKVSSALTGDGLGMQLTLTTESAEAASLAINPFSPLYKVESVEVDGKKVETGAGEPLSLEKGRHSIRVTYLNKILRFSSDSWSKVDLIADGKPNFCIIGNTQRGFDHGTATQLNFFLQQYDEEDGIVGNLSDARIYPTLEQVPEGFDGWKIILKKDDKSGSHASVTLDEGLRQITMSGDTSGAVRKAMIVFTRLLDRKYPHIGRPYPLRQVSGEWESEQPGYKGSAKSTKAAPIDKLIKYKETREFFQKFADPLFPGKPLLEAEHESLYENQNLNFAGRYEMRASPWLFEPTLTSDYVYGYDEKP